MVSLPNGCFCSEIKVTPANWNKKGGSTKVYWRIHYRFYDPMHGKPKQIIIKAGINQINDLNERRAVVEALIRNEYVKLKSDGFNPITGLETPPVDLAGEISPDMLFIDALRKALPKLHIAPETRDDVGYIINGIEKAALQLRFTSIPISQVSRKHIRMVLDQCWNTHSWTAVRYNAYRAYLMMLFTELVQHEAVASNPVRDITKMKQTKKIRKILNDEERKKIDQYLKNKDYRFWLFIHMFFHSGGRIKELCSLKTTDVDLIKQTYKAVVKKGRTYKEVERTIKDVALPFWNEYMRGARDQDYLFGIGFLPAAKPMVPDTITRRWKKRVKDDLGIQSDLYSLKHLNITETVTHSGDEIAAKQNAHTSTAMVVNTYDVHRPKRQHEFLKSVNNKFA